MNEEEDTERCEEERKLELYREYRDVVPMFAFVVETERRFYLANSVEVTSKGDGWVEVVLGDAWVWDMFRPARFVSSVRVMTRRDVNVEGLRRGERHRVRGRVRGSHVVQAAEAPSARRGVPAAERVAHPAGAVRRRERLARQRADGRRDLRGCFLNRERGRRS